MAAGVTLVGIGLLSYAAPQTASTATGSPAPIGFDFTPPPTETLTLTATPSATSPGTSGSPSPSASLTPTPAAAAVATRVIVPSLGIDLPVISRLQPVPDQGPNLYPPCDVAIFHDAFEQPTQSGTAYIYAHAQADMFLPLLRASRNDDRDLLIGTLIEVYTDDDQLFVYAVDEIKRHAIDFSIVSTEPDPHQVVLQTSDGPLGTTLKVQVAGSLVSQIAASHGDSHPVAEPRACYPG